MATDARDPLVDNTGDADQVRFARRAVRDRERKLLEADRAVLQSDAGRIHLLAQLESAGVFRSSFAIEPALMAHNEGRRNEGLQLLARLFRADPEAALSLIAESITRENATAAT